MQITIELPDSLYEELKNRADGEGITLEDLIIRILRESLEVPDL